MSSVRFVSVALMFLILPSALARPDAAPRYSEWTEPVNLGPVVNSPYIDAGPAISRDGLSLFFNSTRPGGFGKQDIWVTQRASVDAPWGAPTNIGAAVNSADFEAVPALSRDEHWLFFNSNRPGSVGSNDLWASYRRHTNDDFGWEPPVNLGPTVNSPALDVGAGYFENEEPGPPLLFFGSDRPGGAVQPDIYVSALTQNGWGPPVPVAELNTPAGEYRPSVRFDGLEIFFHSDRAPSFGGFDLWVATRDTLADLWSEPTNLGPVVNGTSSDQQPYIASDRQTLYFVSNRAGGSGDLDLYVTTRSGQRR